MTRFFIMSAQRAAYLRGAFDGEQRLNPRRIAAGEHAGEYALPERILLDPVFSEVHDTVGEAELVDLDPAAAWPPDEE